MKNKKKKVELEDLKIKIGTKDQAFWERVEKDTEKQIEEHENTLKFLKATLDMSKALIEDEKKKL